MDAKLVDKSLSPCDKQIKNLKPKNQNHHLVHHYNHQQQDVSRSSSISRQGSNINVQLEKMHGHGAVFFNPTSPFSLSSSLSLPTNYHLHHPTITTPLLSHHPNKNTTQPPLLPLPISKPIFHSLPSHIRNQQPVSPPASIRSKQTNTKTKPKNQNPKRAIASKPAEKAEPQSEGGSVFYQVESTKPRNSKQLPKEAKTRVSTGDVTDSFNIFSLSPPPSSLPLPKFSLKQPKLSCTVEAAAAGDQIVDDGATDSLCRMLRLR